MGIVGGGWIIRRGVIFSLTAPDPARVEAEVRPDFRVSSRIPVRLARLIIRSFAFALRPRGKRANSKLAGLITAVAAGTFNTRELSEARTRHWASFAEEHNSRKSGMFDWEIRFYRPFIGPGTRLLVVGAGSGRDVLCFLREGCVVTAIDEAAEALESLRRRLSQAELTADVRPFSIVDFETDDRFDVVVFSWLAYILIPLRESRVVALEKAARVLDSGGTILISYKPGQGSRVLSWISRAVARLLGGTPPENIEQFLFSGSASLPRVYQSRFYTADEIESEAREAGLAVIQHHQGSPGWDDPAWVVLGRA